MRIDPDFAKRITQRERAVFLLVVGLILGTVFVFLVGYTNAPITKKQAVFAAPHFESYEVEYGKYKRVVEVIVRFSDHKQTSVAGSLANGDFMEKIDRIPPGTQVEMLLHPHSSGVLKLMHGEECLVRYDDAISEMATERKIGMCVGVFMYLLALIGAAKLIELRKAKQLKKAKK